ncbi:MAG: type VI secretion system tube protein Hcp [Kiritimatiellae bacterium]|nr:type VI secretion system tube protein Hcp [Kiritimatiellia bacterium]
MNLIRSHALTASLIVACCLFPAVGRAAVDMFVNIDGVKGESTDSSHTDWIDIMSWQHSVSVPGGTNSSSGTGRVSAGRADHADFSFVKRVDKSTPTLNGYCCQGRHIAEVVIDCAHAGGAQEVYYRITLKDVIVTGVSPSLDEATGDTFPTETVMLRYGEIRWEYWPSDAGTGARIGAKIEAGWSVVMEKEL